MNTIYDGSYVIGQTSATNFIPGPGIKIDSPSAGIVRIGNDETVLWSGSKNTTAGSESLYDNMWNYNKVDFYLTFDTTEPPQRAQCITRYYVGNHTTAQPLYVYLTANNIASNTLTAEVMYFSGNQNGNSFGLLGGIRRVNSTVSTGITSYNAKLVEIRGIGRKQ